MRRMKVRPSIATSNTGVERLLGCFSANFIRIDVGYRQIYSSELHMQALFLIRQIEISTDSIEIHALFSAKII